jgi:hypothetical protein
MNYRFIAALPLFALVGIVSAVFFRGCVPVLAKLRYDGSVVSHSDARQPGSR